MHSFALYSTLTLFLPPNEARSYEGSKRSRMKAMKSMNMNRMLGSLKRKREFWTLPPLRIHGRAG